MAEEVNIRQTLTDWADTVIKIWQNKMQELGISNPSSHSFIHHIISNADGDSSKIEFAFDYYLKFTDMGVGKGVTVLNRNVVIHNRIKKQWFNTTFPLEVKKLTNIMAQKYAFKGVLLIKENIKDNTTK